MTAETYHQVHKRLRATFGPARNHQCVDCGKRADEWSYDHGDPNEKRSVAAYSTDLSHYAARCVPCHRAFDFGVKQCRKCGDALRLPSAWRGSRVTYCSGECRRLAKSERSRDQRKRRVRTAPAGIQVVT
jgi:hypothetical protein